MKSWRGQCQATIAFFITSSALLAGCAPKDDAGTATAAGSKPGAGAPAAAKAPTPEQEAAKARAIQQGPAIEAAMAAGPHPKP